MNLHVFLAFYRLTLCARVSAGVRPSVCLSIRHTRVKHEFFLDSDEFKKKHFRLVLGLVEFTRKLKKLANLRLNVNTDSRK